MCGNFYFDVANFEVGGFIKKHKHLNILRTKDHFFFK